MDLDNLSSGHESDAGREIDDFDVSFIEALALLEHESNDTENQKECQEVGGRPTMELTGYSMFFGAAMEKVKQKKPNMTFGFYSKVIANLWKGRSDETKQIYQQKAQRENIIRKEGKSYECQLCNWKFSRLKELKRHQRDHSVTHKCDQCEHAFNTRSALYSHKTDIHRVKLFVCELCDKKFATAARMREHTKIHTENNICCLLCKKQFSTVSNRNKHHKLCK